MLVNTLGGGRKGATVCQLVAAPSALEVGAMSLGETMSSFPSGERPPLEMSSGVLSELFPVSGVLAEAGASTSFPSNLGDSALDSGVPFVVGSTIGGLDCRAGEVAVGSETGDKAGLGSGVGVRVDGFGSGVGVTAGELTLAGVASGAGETAGLASGVVAGLASGVGVNAFGGSGVGLGIGLTSAVVLVGSGFRSGVTACFGSGDGLKVGFVSGIGTRFSFGSGVTAGLGSGVTGGLGSGDGGGGAVDLGAGLGSEAGASFGGEGAVFGSETRLATVLTSGAAYELNTSESAMGAVCTSVSLSSGRPLVLKPTPESLVSRFLS